MTARELARLTAVARGAEPADLVLRGGRVLNVFTGELQPADVAICGETIAGVGSYRGHREIALSGAVVLPGFIEGHIHIESTMLAPAQFAAAVAARGTTTVIADPHEIANVAGLEGVRYLLDATVEAPAQVFLMAPSCVPATPLETAGAVLGPEQVEQLLGWPRVLGLAEMMNFPGVLGGEPQVLRKLAAATGRSVDGHAPGLSGPELQAYVAAGARSEHEATTLEEGREKLAAGMWVMIREGSAARNLAELAPLLCGEGADRCLLVSDDRNPVDLLELGHLDYSLRRAVQLGVPAHRAVRAVTANAAARFGLHDRGAVAPGLRADLTVVADLTDFVVLHALRGGRLVAELAPPADGTPLAGGRCRTGELHAERFALRGPVTTASQARVRVIEVVPGQILTRAGEAMLPVVDGRLQIPRDSDLALLAVVERHHGSGAVGLGLVRGLGLRGGALASTVAHDAHNLVVAGTSAEAMVRAAQAVMLVGGGQAVATDREVRALLPLPVAGLMSDRPLAEVAAGVRALHRAARELGTGLDDPFMTLSFLALPVIPALRLTDRGLVDVERFAVVPLVIA